MGNCRCDLASHLAQHLLTIHTVMAMMRAMAVIVISVFNIAVIAVLMLRRASRLKVPEDVPGHHTEDRNQHKGNHGGLSSKYQGYDEALHSDNGDDAHDGKHDDI